VDTKNQSCLKKISSDFLLFDCNTTGLTFVLLKNIEMKILSLIAIVVFMSSCNHQDDQDSGDRFCYSFDVRGCETDQFSEAVDVMAPVENRETNIVSWLDEQNINVIELELFVQFYDAYCEACYVCTNGDLYTITTDSPITDERAESLELFNFKDISCE